MNHDTIKKTQAYKNDRNCCTVVTLSVLADISFEHAQALMADMGRQLNKGCPRASYDSVYRMFLEFNKDDFASYEGKTVSQFMKSERKFLKNNSVAICTRGHIFAVKNGKIEDWMSANRRHRIEEIYVVEKRKENVNYADHLARGQKLVEKAVELHQAKLEKKRASFTTRVHNIQHKSFRDFKYTLKMIAKNDDSIKIKYVRYEDNADWLDAFLDKYVEHYTIDADVQKNTHKLQEVPVIHISRPKVF
jgi:hypothetical protein